MCPYAVNAAVQNPTLTSYAVNTCREYDCVCVSVCVCALCLWCVGRYECVYVGRYECVYVGRYVCVYDGRYECVCVCVLALCDG